MKDSIGGWYRPVALAGALAAAGLLAVLKAAMQACRKLAPSGLP